MEKNKSNTLLIKIAFWAGIVAVFIVRRNLGAEAAMLNYFGALPAELIDIELTLDVVLQVFSNIIAALFYFDFFDSVHVIFIILLFVPILIKCRESAPRLTLVAVIMISLSLVYYSISSMTLPLLINLEDIETLKVLISYKYIYDGLQGFGLFLFYGFGILISFLMMRYSIFSRYTYVLGFVSNGIGLLYFPLLLLTGEYAYFAIVLAAPFTVAWHLNITLNVRKGVT